MPDDSSQQSVPDYVGDLAIVGRGLHSALGRVPTHEESVAASQALHRLRGVVEQLEATQDRLSNCRCRVSISNSGDRLG